MGLFPRAWGPAWKHERSPVSGPWHWRDYEPAWQRDVYRITVQRISRRAWFWHTVALRDGNGIEIGSGCRPRPAETASHESESPRHLTASGAPCQRLERR